MAITAAQLMVKVGADTSAAEKNLGGLAGTLGKALPLAAAAAVIGIGIASIKMAGDFQESMTQLVTGAGESKANLKLVSDGILDMAVQTGTATQQLSAGMFMIESAGYHGAAGLAVLKASAEGAKVGNADLATEANAVTTVMTDYAAAHETAAQAVNFLTAVVSNGKTHLEDLAGAMSTILPTASAVKVNLNDVGGAMATMTGEGTNAASAATYLRQLLLALAAPAKAGASAIAAIGLTTQQVSDDMKKSLPDTLQLIMTHLAETYNVGSPQYVTALKAIAGGSKQMQGLLELTGDHLATFGKNVQTVADTVKQGGNSIVGWNEVQGDFNFKIDQAKEVVETFMIRLGTGLLPIASKVVDLFTTGLMPVLTAMFNGVGSLSGSFDGLVETTRRVLEPVTTFKTVISDGGGRMHTFKVAVEGTKVAFEQVAGPLGFVRDLFHDLSGALAAVAGWFTPVATQVKEIKEPIGGVRDALSGGAAAFDRVHTAAKSVETIIVTIHGHMSGFQETVERFRPVLAALAIAIGGALVASFVAWAGAAGAAAIATVAATWPILAIGAGIALLAAGIIYAYQHFAPFREIVQAVGSALQGSLGPAIKAAQQAFTSARPEITQLMDALKTLAPVGIALAAVVGGVIVLAIGVAIGAIRGLLGAFQGIVTVLTGVVNVVSGLMNFMRDIMTGNFSHIGADIRQFSSGFIQIIKGMGEIVLGFLSGFVSGIVGFFQGLFDKLVGHSIIPDMIRAIETWFAGLPGRVMGAIASLPGRLLSFGAQLIQHLAAGIASAAGSVASALKNIPVIGGALSSLGNLFPHFATGGTMGSAGIAVVGENGPELVRLPGGARVTPIAQGQGVGGLPGGMSLAGGMSAFAGGITIPVTLVMDNKKVAQAVIKVTPEIIRSATGNRSF